MIKSGNAAILRGGKETIEPIQALIFFHIKMPCPPTAFCPPMQSNSFDFHRRVFILLNCCKSDSNVDMV
jgi:hypothetical protein